MLTELPANVDWETEYNNRQRVPEHPTLISGWVERSARYREEDPNAEIDLPYAEGERNRYDLFHPQTPAEEPAPVHMFIHGGYWQALDKSAFSFVARGLCARGAIVAIPSYTLCPEASIARITDEMRQCAAVLHRRFQRPVSVSGHSAGGHLAAELAATDWPAFSQDLPPGLVSRAVPVSGLFDLRPLVETSINGALGLDMESALACSPANRPAPSNTPVVTVVGGDESSEFHRQNDILRQSWGRETVLAHIAVPGANHFTVLEPYTEPDSSLVASCLGDAP